MAVVVVACVVGFVAVLVALVTDRTVELRGPCRPDWDPLPAPAEVVRTQFPLTFPGYDPVAVEMAVDALTAAYADLLAAAPPAVVDRARRRAATRLGLVHASEPLAAPGEPAPQGPVAQEPTRRTPVPRTPASPLPSWASPAGGGASPAGDRDEALRAEAALSHLRQPRDDPGA